MSSKESKKMKFVPVSGPGNRRLIAKVAYTVPPAVIDRSITKAKKWEEYQGTFCVEFPSPKIKVEIAARVLNDENLALTVEAVHAPPNIAVGISSTIDYKKKPVTFYLDVYVEVEGDDRYCGGDLPGGLHAMRRDNTLTDVELRVDGDVFPAHRAVLAVNSPVFRAMFTSGLKEAQEGVVEIEGTSSTAFRLFLDYLYKADLDNWKDCELELLELADRYLVDHLTAACEERLLSRPRLALTVLQEAANKPVISSELRAKAVRVVVENWSAVSKTRKWKAFKASQPVAAELVLAAKEANLSGAKQI